jgi:uncharacterized protein YaiI (UPF0178 family)
MIFVDADACPVKDEVYRVAKRYGLEVTLVSASWLRVPPEPWIRLEVVRETGGLDAADDWIVEHVSAGDVVIAEDILLASRCLERGAKVLGPRGREFTPDTIGDAVAMRELLANLRQVDAVQGGAAPMTKVDRSRFLQQLDEIVQRLRRAQPAG